MIAPINFEALTATDYTIGQTIGTWRVTSNQVSVITDPFNAMNGNNYLALANGTISTNLRTFPGRTYALKLAYRGPGLVHWWRGESNTVDAIEGINGHFSEPDGGSVVYSDAEVGKGFLFMGRAYLGVPYSPTLQFTNSFTLETWFEDLGSAIPPGYELISDRDHDPEPVNFCINIVNNNGDEGIGITYHDPTDPSYPESGSDDPNFLDVSRYATLPTSGVFHHLAATLQQIAPDKIQIRTFYDGELVRTKVMPGNFTNTLNEEEVTIGSAYGGEDLMMDEVSIYNRGLSVSETKAIYQAGTNGKFDSVEYNVSPSLSLAKAQVLVNGRTDMVFYGSNTNWQSQTITFTATGFSTSIAIVGLEPGMLLDAVSNTK